MFSLQKLLGKEQGLFKLLEASATEARASVQGLIELTQNLANSPAKQELEYLRRKHREIAQEITTAVFTSFTTAIDRADILGLSHSLYRIPKAVEKFSERALAGRHCLRNVDFSRQLGLLDRSTDVLLRMVKSLRAGMNPKQIKELGDELRMLEAEGDKVMLDLYHDLFTGPRDPLQVIVLKDLYELLERTIDRCRSAGRVISQIVLKNS
jgi:uncharacterized protein Yka (UPF0111/DUF47 family)